MKEKDIEKAIVNHIRRIGGWCEALQSWSVMIKKGAYTNKMNLCSKWTPDIIAFYKWHFVAIEVKAHQKEEEKWGKLEVRYLQEGCLPKSYDREKDQIEHKKLILENEWTHILTSNINEVIDYFDKL